MKKKILIFVLSVFGLIWAPQADAVVMNFEDQVLGETYNVGEFIYARGVKIDVIQFEPQAGPPITNGFLSIGNSGMANGSGKELEMYNVNLKFMFGPSGCVSCGIALLFGDLGGDINLGIDGDLYKADDFSDLVGLIPDVDLTVVSIKNVGVLMILKGTNINTFTIGGQELGIDSVIACQEQIPEPATICLLGLGSLSLIRARRKRS